MRKNKSHLADFLLKGDTDEVYLVPVGSTWQTTLDRALLSFMNRHNRPATHLYANPIAPELKAKELTIVRSDQIEVTDAFILAAN